MKTANEVQLEINALLNEFDGLDKDDKFIKGQYQKAQMRVSFLTVCLNFINENREESFINDLLDRVNKKITIANSGYNDWFNNTTHEMRGDNPQQTYNKLVDLKVLKLQKASLEYILS